MKYAKADIKMASLSIRLRLAFYTKTGTSENAGRFVNFNSFEIMSMDDFPKKIIMQFG